METLVAIVMKWNEGKPSLPCALLELRDEVPQRRPSMFVTLPAWAHLYQCPRT